MRYKQLIIKIFFQTSVLHFVAKLQSFYVWFPTVKKYAKKGTLLLEDLYWHTVVSSNLQINVHTLLQLIYVVRYEYKDLIYTLSK